MFIGIRIICKINIFMAIFNYYGIIPINPEKCPNSKIELSEKFINWLLSDYGQALINSFERNGEQLFFGNYKKN